MEEEDDDTQMNEGKVTSHSVVQKSSTRIKAHVTSYSSSSTQKSTSSFSTVKRSTQSLLTEGEQTEHLSGQTLSKEHLSSEFESSAKAYSVSEQLATSRVSNKSVTRMSSQLDEETGSVIPTCQIITHQASNESEESAETTSETDADGNRVTKVFYEGSGGGVQQSASYKESDGKMTSRYSDQRFSAKLGLFSRSATSSSSQEEYEPEIKLFGQKSSSSGQFLTAGRVETTKSMESLRVAKENSSNQLNISSEKTLHAHRGSFLTSSERDMRKVLTSTTETRSFDCLDRDMRLKRRALSGEEMGGSLNREDSVQISAEKRRGLFAGVERRLTPQHLSLPPTGGPFIGMGSSQDSSRKLMILSPHSPLTTPDLLNFSQPLLSIKGRRKKGMVLPKLILPRSDSEASEVFFDHSLLE